ncbi:hypothetical protein [Bradyrhizobium japonicum]|uniref:hypothetical protein n=1 Tax=Bradyrhizobium japonicum TaxID=375 RepID=UPI00322193C9
MNTPRRVPTPTRKPRRASSSSWAAGVEHINGHIHIEKINSPFLSKSGCKGTGPEFGAGIRYAIEKGWLDLHESGTYVRLIGTSAKAAPAKD